MEPQSLSFSAEEIRLCLPSDRHPTGVNPAVGNRRFHQRPESRFR